MSKKTGFPVMSPAITGILYVVGILLVLLRPLVAVFAPTTVDLTNGLFGFLAVFIILWALVSLSLHPAIDANIKTLFLFALLIVLITVMADTFGVIVKLGKL